MTLKMPVPFILRNIFLRLADAACDRRPCAVPDRRRLQTCKIISHRGSFDNRKILENTLAAFDRAAGAGVWGLEMDVRWTRDMVPVVCHDPTLSRVHGLRQSIAGLSRNELSTACPAVPSLDEVVARYGHRLHLMIEIKEQHRPASSLQEASLLKSLQPLEPIRDYHLLALDTAILDDFRKFPPQVRVLVSESWPAPASRRVLDHNWGGFCGHYLLVGKTMLHRHHQRHQQVGTGYPGSLNCLLRELNRGVDWIFSNHAARLQQELNSLESGRLSKAGSE